MKKFYFLFVITFLVLLYSANAISQEIPPPPIEWGKISRADLEMKTYSPDTNASAVILCDYGESSVNHDVEIEFTRIVRIKILTQKGFEWGTHSVTLYNNRESGDRIDDIEGVTYTLSANGDIEENEFDDDNVFEEKIDDDYVRYKFTLPGLTPGCIIEFRYKITSKSLWNVRDWTFQYSEPVRWSEYRMLYPVYLSFAMVWYGYEEFEVKESEEVRKIMYNAPSFFGSNPIRCNFYRFALKDATALRNEPYISTTGDYVTKIDVQFSGYSINGMVEKVMNTWDKTIDELWKDKKIGGRIDVTGKIEDLVATIIEPNASPEKKATDIYNWVSSSIVFLGENTIYADQRVDEVLESKKGTSAEITFLLISMLKAAGIDAQPIMISTRDHGKVQELYPILNQFNYVLVRAKIGTKMMFIDATNPLRPMELLPTKVLNVRGLVLQPDNVEWVTLPSNAKSSTTANAYIHLDENGGATGTIEGIFKEYANVDVRNAIQDSKSIDVAKKYFETDASGLTIDSVTISKSDTLSQPIKIKTFVSSMMFGQANGDYIYLNPHIVSRWNDNPLKSTVRKFPVDYNYQREFTSIVNLTIPDSYEVKEGLKDKYFSVANNGVKYRRQYSQENQTIQVLTKLEILTKEIAPQFYQSLKELYGNMIAAESEQIVLQQKPQQAPVPVEVPKEEKPKQPSHKTKKK